ncbi:hypothetical protein [Vibrio lentus]|uniref:hypothetical protein n=1 Tax=Vibrio lentus TaxID=136468 RepID=UPI0010BD93E0|nr:hypothetical protein [Vibrio lentus]TKG17749.1 hypothetical protein FCW05_12650 [Vibrio lentus]
MIEKLIKQEDKLLASFEVLRDLKEVSILDTPFLVSSDNQIYQNSRRINPFLIDGNEYIWVGRNRTRIKVSKLVELAFR